MQKVEGAFEGDSVAYVLTGVQVLGVDLGPTSLSCTLGVRAVTLRFYLSEKTRPWGTLMVKLVIWRCGSF